MKQIIKIKLFDNEQFPTVCKKGDWIDLKVSKDCILHGPYSDILKKHNDDKYRKVHFNTELIPLGVAMQLPEGMEALVVPRSSTFKKYGIIQTNSVGIIDNCYNGNNDEWKFPALALQDTIITKGKHICQFRIFPSQKATFIQKLKWLLSSGIEFQIVKSLEGADRDGFGSTGD